MVKSRLRQMTTVYASLRLHLLFQMQDQDFGGFNLTPRVIAKRGHL